MTVQLLIYERAVPVSSDRHREWSVKTGSDYAFARNVNSVPLLAAEFPSASSDYAMVFAGTDENVMPMVILGIRENQNAYVDDSGAWKSQYVPAFIRRYPFVFASNDSGETFTLCIDEEFSGCNTDGVGERLFDSAGERTQYLQGVLNFSQAFQAQFQRTQVFCQKLKDLNLLEPMQAQFQVPGGQRVSLGGFSAVNRDRLKAVPGDKLAELAATDELELIFMHLQSLRNLTGLVEKTGMGVEAVPDAASPVAEAEDTAPPAEDGAKSSDKGKAKPKAR